MVSALLLAVFVGILLLVGVLLAYSPGKPEPFFDINGKPLEGSISEKVFLNIGGVKQGMFIRGKSLKNPVLLFVHGGPCFPEYFLVDKYPAGLEDIFTVCYWEQRGGGLSCSSEVTLDSLTLEQLRDDAIEVTNYLRDRFGQEKIYLMAHSGGTSFAIQTAAKAPELFYAYIGMEQITRQAESEKLAYPYLLNRYQAAGNTRMVKKLKEYPVLESDAFIVPFYKSLVRDQAMHELGVGTMRNMKSVMSGVFLQVMKCRAYTLREKINLWIAKFAFVKKSELIDQLFATDLTIKVPKLDIPVYFFSGAYDLTVNHNLSKAYLQQLEAPVKGFYTFEHSAHSPVFEEPERVLEILRNDVLAGENTLASLDTRKSIDIIVKN